MSVEIRVGLAIFYMYTEGIFKTRQTTMSSKRDCSLTGSEGDVTKKTGCRYVRKH